jgi:hypothetical protein
MLLLLLLWRWLSLLLLDCLLLLLLLLVLLKCTLLPTSTKAEAGHAMGCHQVCMPGWTEHVCIKWLINGKHVHEVVYTMQQLQEICK